MKDKGKIILLAYYGLIGLLLVIGLYKIFSHSQAEIEGDTGIINLLINQSMFLAYAAVGIVAVISVIGLVTHFKQSIPVLIGIGVMLALFGIAYGMSSSGGIEFIESFKMPVTEGESRMSEAGLRMMFILGGLTLVGALVSGVKSLFE